MSKPTAAASTGTSCLVRGKLNIVGESHIESNARRDDEILFARAKIGGGYWTEYTFPDQGITVSGRTKPLGPTESGKTTTHADIAEYRALHCGILLVQRFEVLADIASTASKVSPADAGATRDTFLRTDLKAFLTDRDRIWNSLTVTGNDELDDAVGTVFDAVNIAISGYIAAAREDQTLATWPRLTGQLAAARSAVIRTVPGLANVAGFQLRDHESIAELSKYVRERRSTNMGLVGSWTKLTGVWKVGNLHVVDMLGATGSTEKPPVSVDMRKINVVRKEDFTKEFLLWKNAQPNNALFP